MFKASGAPVHTIAKHLSTKSKPGQPRSRRIAKHDALLNRDRIREIISGWSPAGP
jgi:hypothetical protein